MRFNKFVKRHYTTLNTVMKQWNLVNFLFKKEKGIGHLCANTQQVDLLATCTY